MSLLPKITKKQNLYLKLQSCNLNHNKLKKTNKEQPLKVYKLLINQSLKRNFRTIKKNNN